MKCVATVALAALIFLTSALSISAQQKGYIEDLRDITGIEEVPPAPPSTAWAWLVAAALALAGGGLWLHRHRRGRRPYSTSTRSLQRLDRIRGLRLVEKGHARLHATLLANLVRGLVARRRRLPARRQTTEEILAALDRCPDATTAEKSLLRDTLERCDRLKFGAEAATGEECEKLDEMVRRIAAES